MKKSTRVTLYCTKTLDSGIKDSFSVVVPIGEKDTIKKNYESYGYTVVIQHQND